MTINIQNKPSLSFGAKKFPTELSVKIAKKIKEAKSVDIFCHASPDEDTVNSATAIARWIKAQNKKVQIIADNKAKGTYISPDIKIVNPAQVNGEADIAFIVDFNSTKRVSKSSAKLINSYNPNNIIGLDHHEEMENTIITDDYKQLFYIDNTAKSTCSIVYRLFESLGEKPEAETLSNLFCGMVDDFKKFRLINLFPDEVLKTEKMKEEKESEEVFDMVAEKLPETNMQSVLKHLDILGNLNPEEKVFQNKIFKEKIQFSQNNKLAFVVIEPQNTEWIALGQDNLVTSRIIGDFRQRIITNNPDDKLIPENIKQKLDKTQAIIVFYRGPKMENSQDETYRLSINTKNNSAVKIIEEAKLSGDADITGGGHTDRAAAKIFSLDGQKCKNFIDCFIKAADKIL